MLDPTGVFLFNVFVRKVWATKYLGLMQIHMEILRQKRKYIQEDDFIHQKKAQIIVRKSLAF